MPKPLKKKLFRAQFLITKPPKTKYEKIKGISNVLFIVAYKEIDVRMYIEKQLLEDVIKENNNKNINMIFFLCFIIILKF